MTKVSRSAYQKLSEENKRLKRDIRAIVMDYDMDIFKKYEKEFIADEQFHVLMKDVALKYIDDHPEHHWIKELSPPNP